jgi:NAD+ synthase
MLTLPLIDPALETEKITTFIKSTFQKTGKTKAIVAVSGGIDSATSLFLATRSLGPKNVYALHLPAKNSNPQSTLDAQLAITTAQIPDPNSLTISIGAIIQKSWRVIHRSSVGATLAVALTRAGARPAPTIINDRLRLANISARTRMMLLFDQAKKLDALVIGTENLSEHLLGYYTRFGDEASDIEPIRHLYKTQVYELAQFLGVPQPILTKAPSADLWHGQTDANELGFTYAEADPILYQINNGEILERSSLSEAIIKKVQENSFKQQVPYLLHP